MSTNQYRGKEETDKTDFSKLTPEEQKEYSKKHMSEEQDEAPLNEEIAQKEKMKVEKEQSRRIH